MKTPFVAANWKMHKTVEEAVSYVGTLRGRLKNTAGVEVVLAPPFTAIQALAVASAGMPIGVAGQDLYWESQGTFTGEISAAMLKEAGASHVIIGHSERRHIFRETNDEVNKKVRAAIAADLRPIVCVGETEDERDADRTVDVLDLQIAAGFRGLDSIQVTRLVVAYEPVWAIGTGRPATPKQAQAAHAHIRSRLTETFGSKNAQLCRIIYGGSVKPSNAAALSAEPDVDGALVGGAGLEPESFAEIVAKSVPARV